VKNYIYVDFENLNNLKELKPISGKYIFFIGSNQKKLNTDLVVSANEQEVEWIKVTGSGKNALDFHIVYYLAKYDDEKDIKHYILSKDTGFDPLVEHLSRKGILISRIITVDEATNKNSSRINVDKTIYDMCYKNLSKITKAKRPKSIKTLSSHLKALLGPERENQVEIVIDEFFRNNFISSGQNNRLKYME